jgi:hypothetical protein
MNYCGEEKTMFTKHFVFTFILVTGLFCFAANAELVSQWKFNGNANDSWGNNNGTLMNGASIGIDPVHGQVLSLDGYNDYVDAGNNSSLDVGGNSFTVAAWVKRPSTGGVYDIIAKRQPSFPYTGWSFEMMTWNDGQGWRIKLWTPQETGTAALFSFAADTWYHVAAVRDAVNSQISYYVNGQSIGTLAFSNADLSNNAKLSIGRLSEENLQYFPRTIDDARIFNNALSAGDVAAIAPEPCTLLLLGLGGFALRIRRS